MDDLLTRRTLAKLLGVSLVAIPVSAAIAGENDTDEPADSGHQGSEAEDAGSGDTGGDSDEDRTHSQDKGDDDDGDGDDKDSEQNKDETKEDIQ